MRKYRISHRILPAAFVTAMLMVAFACPVARAEGPKYNDPETPKIRASFTVVPETNDIKVLREFLDHSGNKWGSEMRGRYKDDEDYEQFMFGKTTATIQAADKILELCEKQGDNLISNTQTRDEFWRPGEYDSNVVFALKHKTVNGFYMKRSFCKGDPQLMRQFRQFVEEQENDPAREEIAAYVKIYWFAGSFYNSQEFWSPSEEASVKNFQETFAELQDYLERHVGSPYLKHFTFAASIQRDMAEEIESAPGSKVKRGSLMLPTLQMVRPIYAISDYEEAKGWIENIDRELLKYRILAADDPMAAFRESVDQLKQSLNNDLNEDSYMKVFEWDDVASEMDNWPEAKLFLYQSVRPIFVASSDSEIQGRVVVFDLVLNQLALIGEEFELEAVLMDGAKIDLKDYRGKVVLVEYWNTGCGPCIGEFPALKNIYEAYHDKGFEIVAFSTDEDLDAAKAMIEEKQLPWLNAAEKLSKEQNLPDSRKKYNIIAFPTSILIGKDGKVIRADARSNVLYEELPKLFSSEQ